MGFNFAAPPAGGAPAPAAGGFSFGAPPAGGAPAAAPAGAPAANAPAGFAFAPAGAKAPAAPAPAAGGLFGGASAPAPATTPAPAAGGFSFGGAAPAGDATKAATAAPAGGGLFGAAPATKAPAAPAAAGGGLFGATAPAAAGEAAKAPAAPAPPAGGGFSFGGAAPAPAAKEGDAAKDATATPAAKSGFAFGGTTPGTTPAAKAPSPVKTPLTGGAATSAPAGGLFGSTPGAATPAPATGASTAATPAPPGAAATDKPPAPIEPPPIEYQSLTIEQILNRFQSELESDAASFFNEAKRVAHYDATLRETQRSLSELTNGVSRLMLHQSEVDAQLTGIGSYQRELGGTLDLLERNVDELFAAQGDVDVADADIERERGYERAIDVDARLSSMASALQGIAGELNAAQERAWSGGGGEGKDEEVGKIIGVFNAHHETLAYLEGRARAVEADLAVIGQVLARGGP